MTILAGVFAMSFNVAVQFARTFTSTPACIMAGTASSDQLVNNVPFISVIYFLGMLAVSLFPGVDCRGILTWTKFAIPAFLTAVFGSIMLCNLYKQGHKYLYNEGDCKYCCIYKGDIIMFGVITAICTAIAAYFLCKVLAAQNNAHKRKTLIGLSIASAFALSCTEELIVMSVRYSRSESDCEFLFERKKVWEANTRLIKSSGTETSKANENNVLSSLKTLCANRRDKLNTKRIQVIESLQDKDRKNRVYQNGALDNIMRRFISLRAALNNIEKTFKNNQISDRKAISIAKCCVYRLIIVNRRITKYIEHIEATTLHGMVSKEDIRTSNLLNKFDIEYNTLLSRLTGRLIHL